MFIKIFIFIFSLCVYVKAYKQYTFDTRAVGGSPVTDRAMFPYQVSILRSNTSIHYCGGVLISARDVLTAANCVYQDNTLVRPNSIVVVVGSLQLNSSLNTTTRVNVSRITPNPNFRFPATNDLAVLRLSTSLPLSRFINYINVTNSSAQTGTNCFVSGWGGSTTNHPNNSSASLSYSYVTLSPINACSGLYGNSSTSGLLCLYDLNGRINASSADIGSPVVCDNYLAGIVSWRNIATTYNLSFIATSLYTQRSWITTNSSPGLSNVQVVLPFLTILLLIFQSFK